MEKKEAMKILKDFHDKSALFSVRTALDTIIPELKVSEDERIKETLIDYFKTYKKQEECGINTFFGIPTDNILAWLEKQGEHANFLNKIQIGDKVTRNEFGVLVNLSQLKRVAKPADKQGEKPRYSIGDILCDKSCTTLNKDTQPNFEIIDIRDGMYICDNGSLPISQQDEYELVAKKIEQKPQRMVSAEAKEALYDKPTDEEMKELLRTEYEKGRADTIAETKLSWSEHDKKMMDLIISVFEVNHQKGIFKVGLRAIRTDEIVSWLKSLKDKYTWKPSEEQMDALNDVISSRDIKYDVLSELWKDLAKLTDEK